MVDEMKRIKFIRMMCNDNYVFLCVCRDQRRQKIFRKLVHFIFNNSNATVDNAMKKFQNSFKLHKKPNGNAT